MFNFIKSFFAPKTTEVAPEPARVPHFVVTVYGRKKKDTAQNAPVYKLNLNGRLQETVNNTILGVFGVTWRDGKPVDISKSILWGYLPNEIAAVLHETVSEQEFPSGVQLHLYCDGTHKTVDRTKPVLRDFQGRPCLHKDVEIMVTDYELVYRNDPKWIIAYQVDESNLDDWAPQGETARTAESTEDALARLIAEADAAREAQDQRIAKAQTEASRIQTVGAEVVAEATEDFVIELED